ncbi:rod shape-determining protein MreC [Radiobacillus kanasensis]|uniref:rod shape-determining protein MreC n=1 Tax=Radiobacillus kanasensis TaxID=2844358 RepID=UPI001E580247|nr:rod shape-determining protein MreC [Radiobacillus kanasensis]UFT97921.1 rod shape-determining protein MreC [Radiobacillus kanasensis]
MLFFRRKRLFIILIGFIILVGLIGFSFRDRDKVSTVEEFLHDSVGWLQGIVHRPVEFTTGLFENIDEIKTAYKENQLLKERLAQYKNLIHENQELKQENEELLSTLDKTNSLRDFAAIQASVLARSPEKWFEQVTINKGKQDGVKANMAVITGEGMVGKIQTSSEFTSTVQLLSGFDLSNRISVTVKREGQKNGVPGLIEGFNKEKNALLLKEIEYNSDLKKGDAVLSSGLGGMFPKGLPIGTIEEVAPDKYGLTQIAYVTPAADLKDLDHVIVVDRLMEETDTDEAVEGEE